MTPPLDRSVVVDCHYDWLLMFARERSLGRTDSITRRFAPQLRAGGIDVQVSPIYMEADQIPEGALRRILVLIQHLKEEIARSDGVDLCLTGPEIAAAVDDGRLAYVLALEGSPGISADIELFESLFDLGLRMASFTWWGNTLLAGGSGDGDPGQGLSRFGLEALRTFERLGIVMDVSHLSASSTEDVLGHAARPLVASHSGARGLLDHHRNLVDDHIKGIAALGGVVCIPSAIPMFIDPNDPTIERVADHILHVAETAGIDHVGIGADYIREYFDEVYATYEDVELEGEDVRATIAGLESPEGFPSLKGALEQRGLVGEDLAKILGGNLLRVFEEVMGVAG